MFGAGTAAVISPIAGFGYQGIDYELPELLRIVFIIVFEPFLHWHFSSHMINRAEVKIFKMEKLK